MSNCFGSVWDALCPTPQDAEVQKRKSALLRQIALQMSIPAQAERLDYLGTDTLAYLRGGRIDKFTVEELEVIHDRVSESGK